jgi:hypothetical protein
MKSGQAAAFILRVTGGGPPRTILGCGGRFGEAGCSEKYPRPETAVAKANWRNHGQVEDLFPLNSLAVGNLACEGSIRAWQLILLVEGHQEGRLQSTMANFRLT